MPSAAWGTQGPRSGVQLTTARLARASDRPPEAGDGKNAVRVWLVAVSAVEQALWELLGQAVGKPVYALLGGSCLIPRLRLRFPLPLFGFAGRLTSFL